MTKAKLYPFSTLALACLSLGVSAASYEIVELDATDKGVATFATAINSQGQTGILVQTPFNPPIDTSLLNLSENQTLRDQLNDPEAVEAGQISAEDRVIIYRYLVGTVPGNPLFQKLGSIHSFVTDSSGSNEVTGFDIVDTDMGGLTRSVDTYVTDINSQGDVAGYGSAPYTKFPWIDDEDEALTYVAREFKRRGFVRINGELVDLPPEDTSLGGYGQANAITDNYLVAGSVSLEANEILISAMDDCNDEESSVDAPVEVCYNNAVIGLESNYNRSLERFFQTRASVWQLSADGAISGQTTYGISYQPEEDDTGIYASRAADVNEQGIAVGESSHLNPFRDEVVRNYAAIFKDGEVKVIADQEDYSISTLNRSNTLSTATAINNNNVVVGYAIKTINGFDRTKFFTYNLDTEELVFPEDFFPGSASIAKDINDQGQIVGEGEIDSVIGSSTRRRHAFLYDISEQRFEDLNDLVGCDSPYTLVQAQSINENGEISAVATVTGIRKDIVGEPILDDNGNEITEETVMAVKLVPIPGGSVDDCDDSGDKQERQGAGMSWLLLTFLTMLGLRRRYR
ncbi:DUF3466 family protein [Lacimicrobium alkaliphilum]|uniref:GlyGly-CTERM sorting domain-containing protein n=1 Tax=Lacimicrobium alkaliphilum TaxID=1526571 RepID=A0ABQ1QZU8_9ALTE|nr:DUF3466 family protein [Lacimicrobium alkaliphilum]GGD52486.1 hypothetical protein GCM10011357_05420 [Lacimicrobium alkaliphilum]